MYRFYCPGETRVEFARRCNCWVLGHYPHRRRIAQSRPGGRRTSTQNVGQRRPSETKKKLSISRPSICLVRGLCVLLTTDAPEAHPMHIAEKYPPICRCDVVASCPVLSSAARGEPEQPPVGHPGSRAYLAGRKRAGSPHHRGGGN